MEGLPEPGLFPPCTPPDSGGPVLIHYGDRVVPGHYDWINHTWRPEVGLLERVSLWGRDPVGWSWPEDAIKAAGHRSEPTSPAG